MKAKVLKRALLLLLALCIAIGALPATAQKASAQEKLAETRLTPPTTAQLENGTWNADGAYRQIRPALTQGAYWNVTDSSKPKELVTDKSDSMNFFATPRLDREDIPVGSVIVVEDGWQYHPVGWISDSVQSAMQSAVSQKFVVVTEDWWSSDTLRAFNISKTAAASLADLNASDIHEAFHIYVPDEYIAMGYERFYPKLEYCAYWNSLQNKIFTTNTASNAIYYYTTQRLTPAHLPVGSVVVMEEGWENQPEAWVGNTEQSSRPNSNTQKVVQITKAWWGDYTLRAFNISLAEQASLENYTAEDIHCNFRIYIPKTEIHIDGLDDAQSNAVTTLHQLPSMTPRSEGDYEKHMSYIIQTREGEIIIIDGGFQTGNYDGRFLFSYLQQITGDATPHVDAWFFTHPHPDHFAAFLSVVNLYASQITVDAVYHRFPRDSEVDEYLYRRDTDNIKAYREKLYSHAAKLKNAAGETTPVIEINSRHSGKCNSMFDYGDVHIDILLTCEDVFWGVDNISTTYSGTLENNGKEFTNRTLEYLVSGDANETSVVLRVTVNGKTILFPGDGSVATQVMLTRYHDANASDPDQYYSLKSDIVQVSHHGVQSMGKAVYSLINPNVALWCSPYYVYASRPGDYLTTYYVRQWFRKLATTNYVSYDGVDVLEFPLQRRAAAVSIPANIKPYVFDAQYYSGRYPDLAAAYGTDEAKLYSHFINYGIEEGRCASPFFDVKVYMNLNSQSFQQEMKGDFEKAFKHFISNCETAADMRYSTIFDPKQYAAQHTDLAAQGLDSGFELLCHYAANGYTKGELATTLYVSAEGGSYHTKCSVTQPKDAACTADGNTLGIKCTACAEVLLASTTLPEQGHSYVPDGAAADCEGITVPDTAFFVNFTGTSDRYETSPLYGGWNLDSAEQWCYLSTRYAAPVIENSALTTGFLSNDYNHIWLQTGPDVNADYSLNYHPDSSHIVQIRAKFDNLTAKDGYDEGLFRFYYFIGSDRFEGNSDNKERIYALDPCSISNAELQSGSYITLRYPLSGLDSSDHNTITSLRMQFSQLQSISSSKLGKITIDYLYIGPADCAPITYTCTVCGDNNTPDEVAPAGHSYSYTDNGAEHTLTCDRCGDSYTESHSYADGVCVCGAKIADLLIFKSATVTLESDLSLNYYVAKSALEGFSDPYVTFQKAIYDEKGSVTDYEETTVTEYTEKTAADGTECYVFTFTGISAKEMSSAVSVTLSGSYDGAVYSGNAVSYSVKQYAENLLAATEDAALRTLLVDMLNYGAEAQSYFAYNTANLANAGLTEEQKAWTSQEELSLISSLSVNDNEAQSIYFESAALLLEEKVTMNFYLDLDEYTGALGDLYARVFFRNAKGELVEYTIEGTELTELNGDHVMYFDGLNAAQMRSIIGVELYSRQTASCISQTLYYSIETYAYNKLADSSLNPLVTAMMRYGDSVAAYAE